MKTNWFLQLFIIIGFLLLGSGIVKVFHIPVPGSIIGMLLLFVCLLTGIIKLEWIERASSFQLKHLTILFIPLITGLFLSSAFLEILHWNVLIILIVSSICCLLGTAFAVEWTEKRRNVK
ncbi:CidA/LrgA family protein [Virgibacillus byunsanensis]|uniref:CidA/LrgA family protein n=1 Tax=Virgibacillus byunsanensis TaxID=570945 RepID=A0ABW3LM43_9BACI